MSDPTPISERVRSVVEGIRPVCGREVVLREIEGRAAEIVVCVRTAGPCPWSTADGSLVGIRHRPSDHCGAQHEATA